MLQKVTQTDLLFGTVMESFLLKCQCPQMCPAVSIFFFKGEKEIPEQDINYCRRTVYDYNGDPIYDGSCSSYPVVKELAENFPDFIEKLRIDLDKVPPNEKKSFLIPLLKAIGILYSANGRSVPRIDYKFQASFIDYFQKENYDCSLCSTTQRLNDLNPYLVGTTHDLAIQLAPDNEISEITWKRILILLSTFLESTAPIELLENDAEKDIFFYDIQTFFWLRSKK